MEPVFILAVIFASVIILVWMDNVKKERMFLLKQGKDPNIIETRLPKTSSIASLKWGIIVVGVGLGAFFGTIFSRGEYSMYLSFLMIFTGIGLVVSFIVVKKYSQQLAENTPKKEQEAGAKQENKDDATI
ncbi:MAG: hypothetical protein LBH92_06740 [Bacteroidales bacterium]|jgi:F0F1-type ATP synthase assembly protein I|nr:hypothetical protein [Bacteroidales bacterium]